MMSTYRDVKRVSHKQNTLFTMILGEHGNEMIKSAESWSTGGGSEEGTLSDGTPTAGT